jgi:hypothetical protein
MSSLTFNRCASLIPCPSTNPWRASSRPAQGAGTTWLPAPGARLDPYTVIDDVVVPPEYERYVIVLWGDQGFPRADDYVGYNADYTAFLLIRGRDDDGYLWVNHEYVSYPISCIAPAIPAGLNGRPTTGLAVLGFSLPTGASLARLMHSATGPWTALGPRWGGCRVHGPGRGAGAYDAVRREPSRWRGWVSRVRRGPLGRQERAVAGASALARLGAMATPSR